MISAFIYPEVLWISKSQLNIVIIQLWRPFKYLMLIGLMNNTCTLNDSWSCSGEVLKWRPHFELICPPWCSLSSQMGRKLSWLWLKTRSVPGKDVFRCQERNSGRELLCHSSGEPLCHSYKSWLMSRGQLWINERINHCLGRTLQAFWL